MARSDWSRRSRVSRPAAARCGCDFRRRLLLGPAEDRFDGVHDGLLRLQPAVARDLLHVRGQFLGIDERVVALAVIVAAQPDRDVLGIGNLVERELVTGDLGAVDRRLVWGAGPGTGAKVQRREVHLGSSLCPPSHCPGPLPPWAITPADAAPARPPKRATL